MVTPEQLKPTPDEEACEHGYFTACPHCRAKKEKKPKLEVVEGGKEKKEIIEMGLFSEASSTHPERNEDASFVENNMAAIFDGMGGEKAGDVASLVASEAVRTELQSLPENASLDEKVEALKKAFEAAHQAILKNVEDNPEMKGMGTTGTVILHHKGPEGNKLIVGNVGDSRLYSVEDGQARLETHDDSIVNFLVENGILENDQDLDQKIPEHIKNNPQIIKTFKKPPETLVDIRRGVTQAIGKKEIEPSITILDVKPGSRFILTSDGIHDHLTDAEIGKIASKDKSPQDLSKELVGASHDVYQDEKNPRRKKDDDDKTAIVIDFPVKESEEVMHALLEELRGSVADEEEGIIELSDEDLEEVKEAAK